MAKTIDQPYPYCGLSKEDIPAAINNEELKNLYLKSIYWEDFTLQNFFQDLEKRKLLDGNAIFILGSSRKIGNMRHVKHNVITAIIHR